MTKKVFHLLLLLLWIGIGTALRFTNLTGKSPWTDEFATMVFSLGNSFKTLPINQAISIDTLLQPLEAKSGVGVGEVLHHLFTEDHHPPLYFVLLHWWLGLFPNSGEYISLWAARSLPALFGVASIPAVYGLGWLAFRSRLVAQLAGAMMAVSPYSIYLAQETRHYTLAILWVIASLGCLVVTMGHLKRRTILPIWLVISWVIINSFGIATHYFFSLTLCAEAIVMIGFWLLEFRVNKQEKALRIAQDFSDPPSSPIPHSPFPTSWLRISAVIAGTLVGCLVWIPVLQGGYDPQMTEWIAKGDRTLLGWISPVFQALAAWITMISLLPVEASSLLVTILSGVIMLGFFIWAAPILYRGMKSQLKIPENRLATEVLAVFVLGAIALFFGISYILGTDITRGARYNFVYFPAVIVLVAASLSVHWNTSKAIPSDSGKSYLALPTISQEKPKLNFQNKGKRAIVIIWLMGLLSCLTVVSNLGYQKYYRPDLLVPAIQKVSPHPIVIATTHNTLVQTGEMMGIAWELNDKIKNDKAPINSEVKFVLAHQTEEECVTAPGKTCTAAIALEQILTQLPRPLDLWLVNFKAPAEDLPHCFSEDPSQYTTGVDGYNTKLYRCLPTSSETYQ
ncbi:MAG TPA: glycosyltransferase [Cyanobacteria bacterium UBA11149]|nr:glycosyltransferase [Cyanobacteria bacterium UBA11367]HBE59758.1 glycosyltransferase [Cyanobacteria bacterium UBA11366]HBK62073.1 glycosyltransferase [Cyanobacteria bacterium UBA11166]HBR74876.1 glycosyltransferase [Cyanobacteria bacterium UBA11159]HBS70884.1 glycosyltransferase [Cyanobacteria bacterium UBA11153]HBW89501.1 glycosyltransferase [Cyanobacteria bacterium UBA11149]HCA94958.1 glycosyltransferase [Cyanobacteria bacterium UBA9226]